MLDEDIDYDGGGIDVEADCDDGSFSSAGIIEESESETGINEVGNHREGGE